MNDIRCKWEGCELPREGNGYCVAHFWAPSAFTEKPESQPYSLDELIDMGY